MKGKIDFTDVHLTQVGELYLNDLHSDVTLKVEGQALSAHRVILAAKSDYFRTLFASGLKESQEKEVELKETPIEAFRLLLRFIYTGQMSLVEQELEVVLDGLGLAHRYCFAELEQSVAEYLGSTLSVETVCQVFEAATLYEIQPVTDSCYTFIDHHGEDVLEHPSFLKLPQQHVTDIFSRDSISVPEIKIFQAAQKWLESNAKSQEGDILATSSDITSKVRLELISANDLVSVAWPSGLVSPDTILDAIKISLSGSAQNPRSTFLKDVNVVTKEHGAEVTSEKNGSCLNLLDKGTGDYVSHTNIDKKLLASLLTNGTSLCTQCDTSRGASGIVIKLGRSFTINHLRLKLWDEDKFKSYSYIIDVSIDGKDWVRVIDHSEFPCRSSQNLFFQERAVRFIRIIGTGDTSEDFRLVSLEAFYSTETVARGQDGILIPSRNIAQLTDSAIVLRGTNYGDGTGMLGSSRDTDHDINDESTCIVVQLPQPYALDSMRFRLKRQYTYFVAVSTDNKNWERVWDQKTWCDVGWQNITFSRRPVVFIKIKGVKEHTTHRWFYCFEFSCPSPSGNS